MKGLEGVGDRRELQHIVPHSYGHQRCVFLDCSTGGLGALSAGCCSLYRILSLTHLISNSSWLAIGMCHFRRPWNGMFDRHQAEITVMQFTGHSLPVHQSVSVPWDFNPVPFVSQARPRQWNMHFRRLWNSMFVRVGGQYTTPTVRYTSIIYVHMYIYICIYI